MRKPKIIRNEAFDFSLSAFSIGLSAFVVRLLIVRTLRPLR